ncbi:hypothetical protein SELMODRAFT_79165, partial [Selaginella moellendorffii]
LFNGMPFYSLVSWTTMITAYMDCGMEAIALFNAKDLFDSMPLQTVAAWNSMILANAKNEKVAIIFFEMPKWDCCLWNSLLDTIAESGRIDDAIIVFDSMESHDRSRVEPTLEAYLTSNQVGDARKVCVLFDSMPWCVVAVWNAIISSYVRNGNLNEVQVLFGQMPHHNTMTINAMVTTLMFGGKIEQAKLLFD